MKFNKYFLMVVILLTSFQFELMAQDGPKIPKQSGLQNSVDEGQVAIRGGGFSGATSVKFDGISAKFVVVSDGLITATRPQEIKDRATIEIITPGGVVSSPYVRSVKSTQSESLLNLQIVAAAPSIGPASGGTVIKIKGVGFKQRGNLRVLLDGVDAASVSRLQEDELLAVTPPHQADVVSITVKSVDGKESTLDKAFTYVAPPSLVSATPQTTSTTGGAAIYLRGEGFSTTGKVEVMFGNVPATKVTVESAREIVAIAPPYGWGTVDLHVTNPDGQSVILKEAITYVMPPNISSIGSEALPK